MSLVIEGLRIDKIFSSRGEIRADESSQAILSFDMRNLAEAWRRRRYQAAFVLRLNDAEAEVAETQVHIEIAFRHHYVSQQIFEELDDACDKILAQIVEMIDQADRWVIQSPKNSSHI
jgi:four helix bundle protein